MGLLNVIWPETLLATVLELMNRLQVFIDPRGEHVSEKQLLAEKIHSQMEKQLRC
jgi:hypothetical protein